MRTIELMRHYERDGVTMPKEGWEKFVWMAAELVKTAKQMRNTAIGRIVAPLDEPFVQDDLFDNQKKGKEVIDMACCGGKKGCKGKGGKKGK